MRCGRTFSSRSTNHVRLKLSPDVKHGQNLESVMSNIICKRHKFKQRMEVDKMETMANPCQPFWLTDVKKF